MRAAKHPYPSEQLHGLLARLRRRQLLLWLAAGWLGALSLALLALATVLVVESIGWLAPTPRRSLLLAGAIVAALPLTSALLASFSLPLLLRRWPAERSLARQLATHEPEVRDQLLNALELEQSMRKGASEELRREAITRANQLASKLDPARSARHGLLRGALRFAGFALLALAAIAAIGREQLPHTAHRLAHPSQSFVPPGTVLLELALPDTLHVVQGDTLELAVRALHGAPRRVHFRFEESSGLQRTLPASASKDDSSLFTARLAALRHGGRIHARSGELHSDTSLVNVVQRPRTRRLQLRVEPPAYTGLTPFDLPAGVGDVTALPGSQLQLQIESTRPLSSAWIVLEHEQGRDSLELKVRGSLAQGSLLLLKEGRWHAELLSEGGLASADAVHWSVRLAEDLRPLVEVLAPQDGALLPQEMLLPLVARAEDDYGISRMRLRFRMHSPMIDPDSVGEEQYQAVDLQPRQVGPGRVEVRTLWGMADLPLMPGDEVRYFVEAWDNDQAAGPKRARSEIRSIVFPSLDEIIEQQELAEQESRGDLEQALQRAERAREKLAESLEQVRSNPEEMSWEQTQALQQTLEQQEQTLDNLRKVAEQLEQMAERAQQHETLSEELIEKYSRLQELVEEIASPEMREAMEKLREAMEQSDPQQIREALEEMSQNQEQMLENLDRSLAVLEQLRAERRLEEIAKRAEELAERQQELAEQSERASEQQQGEQASEEQRQHAARQQRAQSDLEALREQAEQTAEELAETHPEAAEALRQQAQQMEQSGQPSEAMEQARKAMEQGQPQKAARQSQRAAEQTQALAFEFRQIQQREKQRGKEQVATDMEALAESLLLLSRRQEQLRADSRSLSIASDRYRGLAARQAAIQDGLGLVGKQLRQLMRQSFFVGAPLAYQVQRAGQSMQQAIARYTDRTPSQVQADQTQAMVALHQALLKLSRSQQKMQMSGSGTGYQEMMQKLQQMAQQQQQLNQASGGSMPNPMTMPGQKPGGQQLSQMAARQRALANRMGQLEKNSKGMSELLGSLEGLGEAMEEVARDLEEQNVTERTRRLQRRILQRLLDSQRSLQQRERSRQRTGKVADPLPAGSSPGRLDEGSTQLLRQRLLRALEQDYAEPWRPVIRDYFRALEREEQRSQEQDGATPTP